MEQVGTVGGFDWSTEKLQMLSAADWGFILAALLLIRASSRLGMWFYALIALPGTLAHELAHFVVALVLGARPAFPSLVPRRTECGWRLGSVTFRAGQLRSVPIALAPLLLAPLALYWAVHFMVPARGGWYLLHAWLVGALLSASLPSSADFRIAIPALLLIAVVTAVVWYGLR